MTGAATLSRAYRRMTACVGERQTIGPFGMVWWAILFLALLFSTVPLFAQQLAVPEIARGPLWICDAPEQQCRPVTLRDIRSSKGQVFLRQQVVIPARAVAQLQTVRIAAMGSSEVRWNGVLIGTNGMPAAEAAAERAGSYVAAMTIPQNLVREGSNLLSVRMSFHHLWLPVRSPVRSIDLEPWGWSGSRGLLHYLPSLLTFGALLAAGLYFGFAAWAERNNRSALVLASIAWLCLAQLSLEMLRVFLIYSYPWQLARISGIVLLAHATSSLFAFYAADRFAPSLRTAATVATVLAATAGAVLAPWFDWKALSAIAAGTAAVTACGVYGVLSNVRGARVVTLFGVGVFGLILLQGTEFLDRGWYLVVAAGLLLLIAEQALDLKQARRHARQLTERLCRLEDVRETILLKEGSRTHHLDSGGIIHVKAADDYSEVRLRDGRVLLISKTLSRLVDSLPDQILRVHRSHAVNKSYVASVTASGSGRTLHLTDGSQVPVGRSYAAVLSRWLNGDQELEC
jgi:hypothetical protein